MNRNWTVLLISGSSATGKSILARRLADYYKIPLTEVDDVRIAIQEVLEKNSHPDLFAFLTNPNYLKDYDVEDLVQKLLNVGKEVWKPLNVLIDKHIACNEPVIFEGDVIIPGLLAQRNQDKIKAIFLYDDKENLKNRELERNRGGETSEELADKQAEFSSKFGQELKRQAEENGFMTIKTSPIKTLFERVIKILEN